MIVRLPPESIIARSVLRTSLLRYKLISLLYIVAFFLAVFAFGSCLWFALGVGSADPRLPVFFQMFGVGGAFSVLGFLLLRFDQKEQETVRYHQAIDILLGLPDGPRKEKFIYDFLSKSKGLQMSKGVLDDVIKQVQWKG